MTKATNTKRALLASVISMMLCVVMLAGATFAWFTDTATSGNNRIVAGNLKIDLLAADGSELEEGMLFGENLLWEPGQMYYRELKVVNNGSLAARFNVCINEDTCERNCVLFPNDFNDDGTVKTYSIMGEDGFDYSLYDVIRVAAYEGTFVELKAETEEITGKTYENDRDMLRDALDNWVVSHDDALIDMDANDPGFIWNDADDAYNEYRFKILPPKGEENSDGTPANEKVFTLIAYWELDEFLEDRVDDDYNMNNGKVATHILTDEEYALFTDEDGAFKGGYAIPAELFGDKLESALSIGFDIKVYAMQAQYESDSFGDEYDSGLEFVKRPIQNPEQP